MCLRIYRDEFLSLGEKITNIKFILEGRAYTRIFTTRARGNEREFVTIFALPFRRSSPFNSRSVASATSLNARERKISGGAVCSARAGIYVDVRWHKTQLSDLARFTAPHSQHITYSKRVCHLEKLYDPVYTVRPLSSSSPFSLSCFYACAGTSSFLMRVTSSRARARLFG